MGNDHSQLSGIEISEKATEVTDFWSHHSATISIGHFNNISVFIGEPVVNNSLWIKQTPLEKSCKNLMIYRHPCILRYISSWQKGSKFYLALEDVKPLSHVLLSQSNLQICIGLHSILKALCFLHERALASHNNICIASIYITKDGNWKLGGMEYLCKFNDLTLEYRNKIKNFRYHKAVDPNEEKSLANKCERKDFIDVYAFGVLVNDILKKKVEDIPCYSTFIDICTNDLQNVDENIRPKLSALLQHPFFNHDFIQIHCFLTELPLKLDAEKTAFFTNLMDKLSSYDENIVAKQLSGLLLSRMVLLNKTAQVTVVPFILHPKDDSITNNGLFSLNVFKKYLTPKLLQIFCVRDAQIRQLLLEHFIYYMNCFSNEELQSEILPELLVGIKDTNDQLVAVTLRALADLVPILGASTVIGGKRAKLFNDGRPIIHFSKTSRRLSRRAYDLDIASSANTASPSSSNITEISDLSPVLDLPERPSPDGEEGETSTEEAEIETEDVDNWEDWDINDDTREGPEDSSVSSTEYTFPDTQNNDTRDLRNAEVLIDDININISKKILPNILELDIKNQKNTGKLEDIDFFQDMEPVIQTSKFVIENLGHETNEGKLTGTQKFDVVEAEHHEDGWGDDLDWN